MYINTAPSYRDQASLQDLPENLRGNDDYICGRHVSLPAIEAPLARRPYAYDVYDVYDV